MRGPIAWDVIGKRYEGRATTNQNGHSCCHFLNSCRPDHSFAFRARNTRVALLCVNVSFFLGHRHIPGSLAQSRWNNSFLGDRYPIHCSTMLSPLGCLLLALRLQSTLRPFLGELPSASTTDMIRTLLWGFHGILLMRRTALPGSSLRFSW